MVDMFIPKIPIFEAIQWDDTNEKMVEASEWLGANGWPLLEQADIDATPGPGRAQGHWFNPETSNLMIQWPEDLHEVPVGEWVIKNRRYEDLNFMNDERFNFEYDQYNS